MRTRRRPIRHTRTTASGKTVIVNPEVTHSDAPSDGDPRVTAAGLQGLAQQTNMGPLMGQEPGPTLKQKILRRIRSNKATIRPGQHVKTRMKVNYRSGTATVRMRHNVGGTPVGQTFECGPGAKLTPLFLRAEHDFRGFDLTEATIEMSEIGGIDFRNATLDSATIVGNVDGHIPHINISGASAKDLKIEKGSMSGTLVARNADLTGADFSGVRIYKNSGHPQIALMPLGIPAPHIKMNGLFYDDSKWFDFTDSNITAEQIKVLESKFTPEGPFGVEYRGYPLREAQEILGITDDDEMRVLMWSGEIEVRDNITKRKAENIDHETCHVPQWVIQKHLASEA